MPLRPAILLLVAFASSACHAQSEPPPDGFEDNWKFNMGLGIASAPKYPGSATERIRAMPVLGANYGRFFIGGVPGGGAAAGVGMYLLRESGWSVGVGLGGNLASPRKESDSARLQGMGDISKTALGSVFANYDWRWLAVHTRLQADIGGHGQGTTADLGLEARLPLGGGFAVSAGPSLTWSDHSHRQTFFGVTTAQSASSGLAIHTPGSGLESAALNLGANYVSESHWGAGARVSVGRLAGAAADSPVVEKKDQTSLGLFVNYGF